MAKSKNRVWLWSAGILLVLLVGMIIYFSNKKVETFVTVEPAEKRDLIETVTASGTIQPEIEVKISSEVSGEIIALYVKEGDSVKKGDLLLQVNPDISESNVERARASVNNAKANLEASRARVEQAQARFDQAEKTYNRNKKLHDEKVISNSEFEQVNSDYLAAKGELDAAKQAVDAAIYTVKSVESTLSGEQKTLNRTSIFAPMDGIVSLLNVEKGERVVGTMQMTGTELLRIADFSTMELSVDVGESDIIRVNVGDTAEIEVDAYDDRTFLGIVKEVANSAKNIGSTTSTSDQVTNFEVKITLLASSYQDLLKENRGKVSPFLPGMSGMADIRTKSAENVISVPIEAVALRKVKGDSSSMKADENSEKDEEDKKEVVFLYKDGKANMVPVKTGVQDSRYIQILEGIEENNDVISGPYSVVSRTLQDGNTVQKKDKNEIYKHKKD